MNSVSVKKISSVAVGAAMLGAAFAGAAATVDPSVGNFKFYQNGGPTFKIVVGARAQSSDYWNAAKLAELFGNLAYSDKAIVADTSDLSCTGGGNASACSVTGKGVTLEITTPAGVTGQTGTATVKTQMYDFLDVSQVTATTTRADGATTIVGDGVNTGGYLVSANLFPDVAWRGKIDNVGSYSVTEEENFYVKGKSYYDTSSKKYIGDAANIVYTINFTDTIPWHVDVVNGTITGRPTNDAYITENRNIQVQFLGQKYVITDFENSTTNTIALGSQAVALQMKVGQTVKLGDMEIKLVQISPIGTTSAVLPPAYFEVYRNGTKLDYFSMNKDTANYNKNGIILDAREVFVGGGDTSYVDVIAYASAITLTDGSKISFEGDDATTKLNDDANWVASLRFETKIVGSTAVKALQQIKLSRATSSNKLNDGGMFNLIEKPVARQLKFVGVEPVETDLLKVQAGGTNRYSITPNSTASASQVAGGASVDVNVTWLKSSYSGAFQLNGNNVDSLLIDEFNGDIFYKDPNSANYTNVGTEGNNVTYYYPSTSATGAIQVVSNMTKARPKISTVAASTAAINNTNCAAAATAGINISSGSVIRVYTIDDAGGWSLPVNLTTGDAQSVVNVSVPARTGAAFYKIVIQLANGSNINARINASTTDYTANATAPSGGLFYCGGAAAAGLPAEGTTAMKLRIWEPVTDNSATLNAYYEIDLYRSDASYIFNSSQTGALTTNYASSATGLTNLLASITGIGSLSTGNGGSFEQGFVDPAGGMLSLLSLTEANVKYPKRLAKAVWSFGSPGTTNVTAGGSTVTTKTLAEVESYALGGGYSLKVLSVAGAASCTGGGAAGGLSGTATCAPAKAAVVTALNPATDPLVVMDSQAGGVGPAVVLGGPLVNTLSANTPGAAAIASAPGQAGVRVVGDKVFVYGYTAADTTDAVDALINWVASQRDAVRGV